MKYILTTVVLMAALVFANTAFAAEEKNEAKPIFEKIVITGNKIKPHVFEVEVVGNDEDRARGLMNRTSLPANQGMLFLFKENAEAAFWMKNTLIPLDMIFINANGTIRSIHPMAEPNSRKIIKSGGPVTAGLEIKGGEAQKRGLKPGDMVHYKVFGNELDKP